MLSVTLGTAPDPAVPQSWLVWRQRRLPHVAVLLVGMLVTCAMTIGTAANVVEQYHVALAVAIPAAILQVGPVLLVTRRPLLAWRIMSVGQLVCVLAQLGAHSGWPWAPTSSVAYAVILVVLGATSARRTAVAIGLVSIGLVVLPAVVVPVPVAVYWVATASIAVLLLLGDGILGRRVAESRLAEQRELRRQDLAVQAVLQERNRIARELHDVVAHHMAVIALQAEAAPMRHLDLPVQTVETFGLIRDSARQALAETRRVVGLLRDEQAVEREPLPGLTDVDSLVDRAASTGLTVRCTIEGDPRELTPGVDVCAYRIVQEGLSNAVRHAPGSDITVRIEYAPDAVRLRIENGRALGVPEPRSQDGGHGLVGMRERAEMLGGAVESGPCQGGFVVQASLPYDDRTGLRQRSQREAAPLNLPIEQRQVR